MRSGCEGRGTPCGSIDLPRYARAKNIGSIMRRVAMEMLEIRPSLLRNEKNFQTKSNRIPPGEDAME